jgi:primosomal protein N' (replication factor Y)
MINDITNKDPNIFLDKELEIRRANNLPPFQRFIALIITSSNERELEKEAYKFKNFIESVVEGKVLGPVNAPIFRLKRMFRVRLLIRDRKSLKVQTKLAQVIQKFKFPIGMKLTVDVDPINFN